MMQTAAVPISASSASLASLRLCLKVSAAPSGTLHFRFEFLGFGFLPLLPNLVNLHPAPAPGPLLFITHHPPAPP